MTERQQPPYPAGYRPVPDDDWREQTTPGLRAVPGPGAPPEYGSADYHRPEYEHPGYPPADYPQPSYQEPRYDRSGYEPPEYGQTRHDQPGYGQTGYGQTGYGQSEYGQSEYGQPGHGQPGSPTTAAPDYSSRPVAVRRPDVLAGLVLVLAGIAAGVSLLLKWLAGSEETGWTLLREGVQDLGGLFRTGLWQPLAIVVGGVLLLVVGLIVLVPARAHRTLGLVALLLTAAVAAGVLVPLEAAHWRLGVFDIGFFCAIGVAVLGLIGALKALLTGPRARP
jgi:hypothetical protein